MQLDQLWLHRLPELRIGRAGAAARAHRGRRRQRRRARPTCWRPSATWPPCRRSGARRPRRWCGRARRRRWCGPRATRDGPRAADRGRDRRRGRGRVHGQPAARCAGRRDLLGALRVTVFAPDDLELVKGGPAARRRYLDDTLVALHPRTTPCGATSSACCASATPCCARSGGRLDAPRSPPPSTCGTPSWPTPATPWPRPGPSWSTGWSRRWPRPTPSVAGPSAGASRRGLRGPVARRRAGRGPGRGPRRGAAPGRVPGRPPPRRPVAAHRRPCPPAPTPPRASSARLALALRLAAHAWSPRPRRAPVLLLDDVFSELDPGRTEALLAPPPARPGPAHHRRRHPAAPGPTVADRGRRLTRPA